MDTLKVIMVPLAVLLLGLAVVLPPAPNARFTRVRWVLAGAATVLAAIALFVAADSVS